MNTQPPLRSSLTLTALLGCFAVLILGIGVGLISVVINAQAARATPAPTNVNVPAVALLPSPTDTYTPTRQPSATFTATKAPVTSPTPVIVPLSVVSVTLTNTPGSTLRPTITITPPFVAQMQSASPAFRIIPDSELVNSPAAADFSITAFIKRQPGIASTYTETVFGRVMTTADSVRFVSTSTSVNPRILLALLEYRSQWLTNPKPDDETLKFPLGYKNDERKGLISQLFYAANTLNVGYYGYKTRGLRSVTLPDKTKIAFNKALNPGTIALQYYLGQQAASAESWLDDISPKGVFQTYARLFGAPFDYEIKPLVPPDLKQPTFLLPFAQGEVWFFTAGPHGGWDHLGSAWGAVDFAPPKPPDDVIKRDGLCYVSTYYARALAKGKIVRARDGAVVLDLDMDGDERTGWTILYLHIAIADRAVEGSIVEAGDPIGHPSCQGFFLSSPGTHLHIARRYNGEWIATDCRACQTDVAAPDFVMGGWIPRSLGDVSFGYLEAGDGANMPAGTKLQMRDKISW